MFPWVCLATMPLFCPFDWPTTAAIYFKNSAIKMRNYTQMLNLLRRKIVQDNFKNARKHDNKDEEIDEPKVTTETSVQDDNKIDSKLNNKLEQIDEQSEKPDEDIDKTNDALKNSYENTTNGEKNETNDLSSRDQNETKVISKEKEPEKHEHSKENRKLKKTVTCLIGFYVFIQAFLPYSHFITKGYNNWTNGLYGYSWDMMVETWTLDTVIVKIVDNRSGEVFFIDPYTLTPNDRWTRHGDMILQYADCLKTKFKSSQNRYIENDMSIHIDVWCSLNGRFTQRMFDPKVDLTNASWSPFKPVPFLMPLIDEALHWRQTLNDIKEQIYAQNSSSDVIFLADFPGYDQEKFIPVELYNVTLTVLDGSLAFEPGTDYSKGKSVIHMKGDQIALLPGTFHRVINVGTEPVFYMYTYVNLTQTDVSRETSKSKLPIAAELSRRFKNMFVFANIVVSNIFKIFLGTCSE